MIFLNTVCARMKAGNKRRFISWKTPSVKTWLDGLKTGRLFISGTVNGLGFPINNQVHGDALRVMVDRLALRSGTSPSAASGDEA